ncbi:hypothetical protein Ancab_004141, partial [Ancistrocladus abbreviatus]
PLKITEKDTAPDLHRVPFNATSTGLPGELNNKPSPHNPETNLNSTANKKTNHRDMYRTTSDTALKTTGVQEPRPETTFNPFGSKTQPV